MAIEKTVTYADVVPELADAWSFVMTHLDEVGPDPHITIQPSHRVTVVGDDVDTVRMFGVSVSGMVPQ